MSQKKYPQKLFHYTNIETLAYILSDKQFKFTRLDLQDDMTEGQTEDTESAGKYYFISSWSSLSEENLAFWSMYTENMRGIRIELEPFPFLYYFKESWITHEEYVKIKQNKNENHLPSIESTNFSLEKSKQINHFNPEDDFLREVEYTDDKSLLKPNYFTGTGAYRPSDVGKYKRKIWKFQQEWRYVIHFEINQYYGFKNYPINSVNKDQFEEYSHKLIKHAKQRGTHKELIEKDFPDVTYKMVKLSDHSLKKMKILLGPKCSDADKVIVESIFDHFNLLNNVELTWSSLKNTIR